MTMTTTYTTHGSVRGGCGHQHRTLAAALGCAEADQRDCREAGGYSDRHVRTWTPEGPERLSESDQDRLADLMDDE